MNRKIMIVVEQTGPKDVNGDTPFNVYLAGDLDRLVANPPIPDSELDTVEFWGTKLFNICKHALVQSGAARGFTKNPALDPNKKGH